MTIRSRLDFANKLIQLQLQLLVWLLVDDPHSDALVLRDIGRGDVSAVVFENNWRLVRR